MAKQRILEIWQAAIDAGHPEWVLLPYGQAEAFAEGKNRYFNGLPCKRLHVAPRIALTGHCTACDRSFLRQYAGLRRSTKMNATPPWLTADHHSAMSAIYEDAARQTRETGTLHEVDHVIPLTHPDVCGPHVPWNLKVRVGSDNRRKSNKFDGTMENESWRGLATTRPRQLAFPSYPPRGT